jgi:hypothetical protein
MASGKKGGIGSFFKKVTTTPSVATLSQLQSGLESAAARSIAIVTERWPVTHPAFKTNPGKAQSLHGGCGALWMTIHGHSAAYGVPAFNVRGVWLRATSTDGKKHTGKALETAKEAFRTRLILQLRRKWEQDERELLSSVPVVIAAAEVSACHICISYQPF